jgi:hypothetical protein
MDIKNHVIKKFNNLLDVINNNISRIDNFQIKMQSQGQENLKSNAKRKKNNQSLDSLKNELYNTKLETELLHKKFDHGIIELMLDQNLTTNNVKTFLIGESIVQRFSNIVMSVKSILDTIKCPSNEISLLLSYKDIYIDNSYDNKFINMSHIKNTSYNICDKCQTSMAKLNDSSIIYCVICGATKNLKGTIEEEIIVETQESKKQKYVSAIIRNTQQCLDYIQAKIAINIPEKLIDSIKKIIENNKIKNLEIVTCEMIRQYLKMLHADKFNNCVSLIRKIITGITPHQLSEKEEQMCISYVKTAVEYYDKYKDPEETNRPYGFYFIYKVLDIIIDGKRVLQTKDKKIIEQVMDDAELLAKIDDNHLLSNESDSIILYNGLSVKKEINKYVWIINDTARKHEILMCMHLQSRKTLIKRDKFWEMFCEQNGEFPYRPTIKNV